MEKRSLLGFLTHPEAKIITKCSGCGQPIKSRQWVYIVVDDKTAQIYYFHESREKSSMFPNLKAKHTKIRA